MTNMINKRTILRGYNGTFWQYIKRMLYDQPVVAPLRIIVPVATFLLLATAPFTADTYYVHSTKLKEISASIRAKYYTTYTVINEKEKFKKY